MMSPPVIHFFFLSFFLSFFNYRFVLYHLSICQSYVMMHGLAIVQRYNILCDGDSW